MSEPGRLHPLALMVGVGLMVGITLQPQWLTTPAGEADHRAALLMLHAMATGLVNGVGFRPRHSLPKLVLGRPVLWLSLLAGLARLASLHGLF